MLEELSAVKSFGGLQKRFQHKSVVLNCYMNFSVYVPPVTGEEKIPAIYWLSGLTCTDENFVTKAGAQKYAAKEKIILVCADTSPRGDFIPDDEDGAYDFGLGAGFYLNATELPWSENYQMYDYIIHELPKVVEKVCPIDISRVSISGHSMGGHGALIIGLKNNSMYSAISAFSPICSPSNCPWGKKAFSKYLGGNFESNRGAWLSYDAVEIIKDTKSCIPILIDQGTDDEFLKDQLKTELLKQVISGKDLPVKLRYQKGYDHSYFFISSFIGEHIKFHSKHLKAGPKI